MALKKFKATSPGKRHMSVVSFDEITRTSPEKSLIKRIQKHSGRNNRGKITCRHRGGGHKRVYRMVDFKQTDKLDIPGKITTIEYDPIRTAYIMLVTYADGEKRYHIMPEGVEVGEEIQTKVKGKVKAGNRMTLGHIPLGYEIHNVELVEGKGGQVIRSAGGSGAILSLEGKEAQVQMPSGEVRLVSKNCYATIGKVSNEEHANVKIGKAGRKRWMGRRPQVRGKAMNPCDHPHGGGEGNQPIGLKHPKTPWGMPALGYKTRRRRSTDNKILKSRHHG